MTQITQTSNALALSMLQRLLQSQQSSRSSAASSAGQQAQDAGQFPPGPPPMSGFGGPQLSGQTMSGMMDVQAQPQSASDLASGLLSSLDSDGDGELSLDELQQALNKAGMSGDISQAFSSLDTDGDGKLSSSELTSGLQTAQAHHHHGGHHHMAQDIAQDIASQFDTDGDGELSIAEINSALGKDSSDNSAASSISALDTDGDGKLSVTELTAAIQQRIQQAIQAYAQQQQAGEQSVASA